MGDESGVYTIEEAIKAGLYTPPSTSPSSIKVFEDGVRQKMFSSCAVAADVGYARIRALGEVYQNEICIDSAVRANYLMQIESTREFLNRTLNDLEHGFKTSCDRYLVNKNLNEA